MVSLFNALFSIVPMFLLSIVSFMVLFAVRQLCIRRLFFVLSYYVSLAGLLFIAALGGGGVQNDGYTRLEQFIELEKTGQLETAKNNLQQYDRMFCIDLEAFKSSAEFKEYLCKHDAFVDKAEAVSVGWLFAVGAEIALVFVSMLRWVWQRLRKK